MTKAATVIADASWCPKKRVAGYACWIAADGIKSQGFSGPIAINCSSSWQAEMIAAAIGITIAVNQIGATAVLIQSDCEKVKEFLTKPEVRQEYLGHLTTPLSLRWKHVKGHTQRPEARFWVNRWCDKNARRHMREKRDLSQATG